MKVLLIEDDEQTARSISLALSAEGIVCDHVSKGEEGIEVGRLYDQHYDLIILDLMLPDVEGYQVLLRIRNSRIKTPVLILSGLASTENKIKGLGLGADDYLSKPFNRGELIARVQAVIRRSKGYSESVARFDQVLINFDTRTVEVAGKPLKLTAKEYGILELLAMRKGTTISKEMFLNHIYGYGGNRKEPADIKIIDVFVCKLRKKLEEASGGKNYIETVWGRGYILNEHEDKPLEEQTRNSFQEAYV